MSQKKYVITDGDRFIYQTRNGKYIPTPSEAMADFYTKEEAKFVLQNKLPKPLRASFRTERKVKPPKGIKQVTKEDMLDNVEKVSSLDTTQKWLEKIKNFNGLYDEVAQRKLELDKELSTIEAEIQDCMHYIEFAILNAAQGYQLYKILKEKRIKRRSIKNEQFVLNIIIDQQMGQMALDEIEKRVAGLDKRQYKPRVLDDLFDL